MNTSKQRITCSTNYLGSLQGCVAIATGFSAGLWDILPCSNKEKYICKHMAEGVTATVPPPTQTPPKCPEGWNPVGTRSVCAKVKKAYLVTANDKKKIISSEKTRFYSRNVFGINVTNPTH